MDLTQLQRQVQEAEKTVLHRIEQEQKRQGRQLEELQDMVLDIRDGLEKILQAVCGEDRDH